MDGDELYGLVETYAAFGDHQVGGAADAPTLDWYESELERRGLRVEREPVGFDRYVCTSTLTADGAAVDHLPLFYEWTGVVDTDDVHVALIDIGFGGPMDSVDAAIDDARTSGRTAAVLATQHPAGSLRASNRTPTLRGGDPTVLIAGRDHARVHAAGAVRLTMDARLDPATATNLVARNDRPGPPLLITTPLNGWFGSAGERGTGIAVLLDLVERFVDTPLLVVATAGHELDYFGARRWVESYAGAVRAVVHVGASVAVDEPVDGGRRLIATRVARTNLGGDGANAIETALAPAGFIHRSDVHEWGVNEAEAFAELGAPMLSLIGAGLDFHTPDDTPERATSPTALATVGGALGAAVQVLLDAG